MSSLRSVLAVAPDVSAYRTGSHEAPQPNHLGACRQQGRALLQQLLVFVHDHLVHGTSVVKGFDRLCAKQRVMVPSCHIWLAQITTVE
jgi:hypothetical protein